MEVLVLEVTMASTLINICMSDNDIVESRSRISASCHTITLQVGDTGVRFFIHNQEQYNKLFDAMLKLIKRYPDKISR